MAVSAGTRIGPYEVVTLLGEGGMGEVYRAHDPRLNRDVALKVLSDHVTLIPDRLDRLRREAQVLASLNHPTGSCMAVRQHGRLLVTQPPMRTEAWHRLLAHDCGRAMDGIALNFSLRTGPSLVSSNSAKAAPFTSIARVMTAAGTEPSRQVTATVNVRVPSSA